MPVARGASGPCARGAPRPRSRSSRSALRVRPPDLLEDLAHGAILPARWSRREKRIIGPFVDGSVPTPGPVQTPGKERVMATQTDATTIPESRTTALYQEGLVAGLVGAATIAVWFLILDSLSGRPLYTPTVLGTALFRRGGTTPLSEILPNLEMVLMFTWVHGLVFVAIGGIVAR